MPGRLRYDDLDVNDRALVERVIEALTSLAGDSHNRHALEVSKRYYFSTPNNPLASDAGWYIICDASHPLYVGTAENLNARLNSENGSRDQFANPRRMTDSERNFIKSFKSSGLLGPLSVIVIPELVLCSMTGVTAPLTKRDRHNIEKLLNLFRDKVTRHLLCTR